MQLWLWVQWLLILASKAKSLTAEPNFRHAAISGGLHYTLTGWAQSRFLWGRIFAVGFLIKNEEVAYMNYTIKR
jgi:hypothetical protein